MQNYIDIDLVMSKDVERSQTGVLWQRWQLCWGLFFMALRSAGEYVEHTEESYLYKIYKQARPVGEMQGRLNRIWLVSATFRIIHIIETLFSQLEFFSGRLEWLTLDIMHHWRTMPLLCKQCKRISFGMWDGTSLIMLCLLCIEVPVTTFTIVSWLQKRKVYIKHAK